MIEQIFNDVADFVRKAYAHRIPTQARHFIWGIALMIVGWQLIGIGNIFHEVENYSWLASLTDYSVQMVNSTVVLALISIFFFYIRGKGFTYGLQHLKITTSNEVLKDKEVRHLSYAWRVGAIYLRAVLATGGYYLFELARVFTSAFDNSALHGADALFYALLFGWWVERKTKPSPSSVYSKLDWIGMGISAGAIVCAFVFDASSSNLRMAILGVSEGFCSSIALACIILISGIVVYHDSVIRISFHNCLFGAVISMLLVTIILFNSYKGDFSELLSVLKTVNFKTAILSSTCYAIALICFLQSYRYIQPTLVAMLGNWLGVGTGILLLLSGKALDIKTLIVTLALILGSLLLGIGEWEKEKHERRREG